MVERQGSELVSQPKFLAGSSVSSVLTHCLYWGTLAPTRHRQLRWRWADLRIEPVDQSSSANPPRTSVSLANHSP
jgi:hypothetical protein